MTYVLRSDGNTSLGSMYYVVRRLLDGNMHTNLILACSKFRFPQWSDDQKQEPIKE